MGGDGDHAQNPGTYFRVFFHILHVMYWYQLLLPLPPTPPAAATAKVTPTPTPMMAVPTSKMQPGRERTRER